MPFPSRFTAAFLLASWLALFAAPAHAHLSGVSQVRMVVGGPHVRGEWEIHLHDARLAIGIEPTLAGDSGWVDLRRHETESLERGNPGDPRAAPSAGRS